jgi:hypothetical protein
LSTVTFESVSRLQRIEAGVFDRCHSLESICIPGSVDILEYGCFSGCAGLSTITFESGSKLEAFPRGVFWECHHLNSISLPASIVRFYRGCFSGCRVSNLIFQSPSHLESLTLSIPDDYCGEQLEIPDSVDELIFEVSWDWKKSLIVDFGRESRLRYFNLSVFDSNWLFRPRSWHKISRRGIYIFCRFSESKLKSRRELLEFGGRI